MHKESLRTMCYVSYISREVQLLFKIDFSSTEYIVRKSFWDSRYIKMCKAYLYFEAGSLKKAHSFQQQT